MSQQLISRSPDLKKLRDEGYDVAIVAGHLLVKDVPYVNTSREVKRGTLVSTLTMSGDVTAPPDTHVAMFIGEYPCDQHGAALEKIRSGGGAQLADGLAVDYSFSSKPIGGGYPDYHAKVTAYVAIIQGPAQAIEPNATARTFPVLTPDDEESVFHYLDTATSRAGIGAINDKLKLGSLAIVGLGGTGSYVLDLVVKTPVEQIHLFDEDLFLSHNAFRAPSAASLDELRSRPRKVDYLCALYSKMRRGIVPHPYNIDSSNVEELRGMEFVFLCMDAGPEKKLRREA